MNSPQLPEPVQRLLQYAGQTMHTARNPNLTAREAITVGNWIATRLAQPAEPVAEPQHWACTLCWGSGTQPDGTPCPYAADHAARTGGGDTAPTT